VINVFIPTPVPSIDSNEVRDSFLRSISIQSLFLGHGDRLGEFLAGLPAVVYECDKDLAVTRISTNAAELLGMEPANLLGRRDLWADRLHPKDRINLISRLEQLQLGEGASTIHRILSELDLPVWVSHSFRKVRTKNSESIWGSLVPLPTDLCTQSVHSNIISQFVHKIGNHFQLINLLMGTLRRSGEGVDEIDALQQAVDRTVDFTRAFLDYAQIPTCQSDFELHEVLNTVVQAIQVGFDDKHVALVSRLEDCFRDTLVRGDPFLFERALGSIFRNALEATSAGDEVILSGNCEYYQSMSKLAAQIVVADTGSGMQTENLCRAEDPFFTSRRDRDGLGLSMAARIIEQHGGTLRIDSKIGQGTQVTIVLPVIEVRHDRPRYGAASQKSR
jgi:signal transduction histidine kinase